MSADRCPLAGPGAWRCRSSPTATSCACSTGEPTLEERIARRVGRSLARPGTPAECPLCGGDAAAAGSVGRRRRGRRPLASSLRHRAGHAALRRGSAAARRGRPTGSVVERRGRTCGPAGPPRPSGCSSAAARPTRGRGTPRRATSQTASSVSRPIRSASASGPIGCAQPGTMPSSMSSLDAKPDSYIRIADTMYGISSALTTKPARSWESIVVLPSVPSANVVRLLDASRSAVMIERTTSTSGSTGTGLKKCRPSTRSGCLVSAPSFMIGTDDVFEARNRASGSSASRRAEQLALDGLVLDDRLDRGVGALERRRARSRTRCARAAAVPARPRRACPSARRDRASARSPRSRARARSPSSSTTVTSTPERAQTSAIPLPMSPPPTTPTRMGGTLSAPFSRRADAELRRPARRRRSSAASPSRAGPSARRRARRPTGGRSAPRRRDRRAARASCVSVPFASMKITSYMPFMFGSGSDNV